MAKKKQAVTNAMRMLTSKKVSFDAIYYEVEGEIERDFGEAVAEKTGIKKEQSFKTLVARGEHTGILVCCVPVCSEVDLKKLAVASGNKRVELICVKELLGLTGYVRGGVSPIGMKKSYPTYLDDSCKAFEKIAVSGGVCGCTLWMNTEDVIKVTGAKVAPVMKGEK